MILPVSDVPLVPTPSEGRSWLRRELLEPEYRADDPLQLLMDWIGRVIDGGAAWAQRTPPLALFAAMLVVLLLVVAVGWLLGRTERSPRRRGDRTPAVDDPSLTALELRSRADAAFAEGRWAAALVDAFRATATRRAERGALDDLPGLTAHEVAEVMAADLPDHAPRIRAVARDFDLVLYGDRPADEDRAAAALALDDELSGRRVRVP